MSTIEWLLTAIIGGACWELWDLPEWPHYMGAPIESFIEATEICERISQ